MSETQTGGRAEGGAPGPARGGSGRAVLTKYRETPASYVLKLDASTFSASGRAKATTRRPPRPCSTSSLDVCRTWNPWHARRTTCRWHSRKRLKAGGADPDRLADVEGEMGGAVELAQTWAVMPGTITYADAAKFMLDALGYGPGGQS